MISKKVLLSFVNLTYSLVLYVQSLEFYSPLQILWVYYFLYFFSFLFVQIYFVVWILRKRHVDTFFSPDWTWLSANFNLQKFILFVFFLEKVVSLSLLFGIGRLTLTFVLGLTDILSLGFLFVFSIYKFFCFFKVFHSQEFCILLNRFFIFGLFAFEPFFNFLSFCFVNFWLVLDLDVREKVDLLDFVFLSDSFFLLELYFSPIFLFFQNLFESFRSFWRIVMERGDFFSNVILAAGLRFFL